MRSLGIPERIRYGRTSTMAAIASVLGEAKEDYEKAAAQAKAAYARYSELDRACTVK